MRLGRRDPVRLGLGTDAGGTGGPLLGAAAGIAASVGLDYPVLGIVLALVLIYLTGLFVSSLVGRFFLRRLDGGPIVANSNYGQPNAWQAPLFLRLGGRLTF